MCTLRKHKRSLTVCTYTHMLMLITIEYTQESKIFSEREWDSGEFLNFLKESSHFLTFLQNLNPPELHCLKFSHAKLFLPKKSNWSEELWAVAHTNKMRRKKIQIKQIVFRISAALQNKFITFGTSAHTFEEKKKLLNIFFHSLGIYERVLEVWLNVRRRKAHRRVNWIFFYHLATLHHVMAPKHIHIWSEISLTKRYQQLLCVKTKWHNKRLLFFTLFFFSLLLGFEEKK